MHSHGSPWGSRNVGSVASTGDATQLFPVQCAVGASTQTEYPPAAPGGFVRTAIDGRIGKLLIESDGLNGGYCEVWDVAGLREGAAGNNNVNNDGTTTSILLTNAYLAANGTLLATVQVKPDVEGGPFGYKVENIPFNKGLAVRFVSDDGHVKVSPFIEGGFRRVFVPN